MMLLLNSPLVLFEEQAKKSGLAQCGVDSPTVADC